MPTDNCPVCTDTALAIENVQPAIKSRLTVIKPGRVVQPYSEDLATHLLNNGSLIRGPKKLSTRGLMNRCHYNASLRWLRNPKATIFYGYQNPSDHCWTQHSWNVCEGTILDRHDAKLYFGVTPKDPARFALHCIFDELGYSLTPSMFNRFLGKTATSRLLDIAREQMRAQAQIESSDEIVSAQCSHDTRHMLNYRPLKTVSP